MFYVISTEDVPIIGSLHVSIEIDRGLGSKDWQLEEMDTTFTADFQSLGSVALCQRCPIFFYR